MVFEDSNVGELCVPILPDSSQDLLGLPFGLGVFAHQRGGSQRRAAAISSRNRTGDFNDARPSPVRMPDGSFDGIAVRVVSCALDAIGRAFEIHVLPWKRAQLEVQNGYADGFFAASQNARRDAYATASAIIARQTWTWYLLKDQILSPKDPANRLSMLTSSFLGANMQTWLRRNGYRTTDFPPRDTNALLEMLLAGRVDAVLANNLVMESILDTRGVLSEIRSEVQQDKPLSVYFSNDFLQLNPGFLAKFDAAVPDCRDAEAASGDINS